MSNHEATINQALAAAQIWVSDRKAAEVLARRKGEEMLADPANADRLAKIRARRNETRGLGRGASQR